MTRRSLHRPGLAALALVLWAASGATVGAGSRARAQDDERERGEPRPTACTSHRTETPYRNYGYDHVVVIANRCGHVEHCTIEASSAPGKEEVDIPAQGERSVTVRRGSPAREFTAKVTCKKK